MKAEGMFTFYVDTEPPPPRATVGRVVLGSFLSALAGWATLFVLPLGLYFLRPDDDPGNELSNFLILPVFAAFFILPVWLVVLLPLYRVVPPDSVLWHWPVCTLCGAVSGGAIMLIFCVVVSRGQDNGLPLVGFAAVAGGATCLFGSLTRRWLRFPARA